MRVLRVVALFGLAVSSLNAAPLSFQSQKERSALLELYTSEGCSSCPPAESWLSSLKSSPALWRDFVPVAFHVDYWNSLGWIDKYSSPQYSNRQHRYASAWNAGTVYTPEFVLDGQEWRRGTGDPTAPAPVKTGTLQAVVQEDGHVLATFAPLAETLDAPTLRVAPLGMNVISQVRKGENSGRKLTHDFVALALLDAPMKRGADGTFQAEIAVSPDVLSAAGAIAVWVESASIPVQAVGGLLSGARE